MYALLLRLPAPNKVHREVEVNRWVLKLLLDLGHEHSNLFDAPAEDLAEELGCV